ncbi:hypothetical protein CQ020_17350 [Arthrobacter sp. MYb23]|uniref:hypothetical protein n=1 Tax=unclassified Arthrobacter TaxID=235627 RepID=UPI000CFD2262|nr:MULTISPECIES: hypothetical protein [unclassified Arthrobacter]PRB41836.1 hypothetical protein CQ038_11950 [Arthrobacter sp. MYb51]PRB93555.1 hypothetical protein CQ020_17350 [Arthrobacter sp. MYb23]
MNRNNARRRRRRLALWSAPPALLALAVAAKLLSVGVLGASAGQSFDAGEQEGVATAASWLQVANILEPHKGLFVSGDAHVLAGDFAAARKDFESALEMGAGVDECRVRVNLVLSIEKLGDAAGDPDAAALLFTEAKATVESAPPQCHAAGPANSAGEGESLDAAQERLKGKLSAGESPGKDPSTSGQATQPPPNQEQLQQLEESGRQAQLERSEGQERGEYLRGPDKDPGVNRPW